VQSRMRNGGIARTARRAVAVAVLGWLAALGGSVLVAPTASADPAVTVAIRDLTPPVVSVDANGTVTFVNQVQDKPVQVGGAGGLLPALVNVTVHTDVTLRLPSGTTPLAPGASVDETFPQSCVTCSITFSYRMDSATALTGPLTDAVTKLLPPLPLPTPFVVNTLVPLPNLPSVNLPQLPPVDVPVPSAPVPTPAPSPEPPSLGGTTAVTPPPAPAPAAVPSVGGTTYSYGPATSAAQLAPTGDAGTAFDPSRLADAGRGPDGLGTPGTGSGGGGVAGSYDGAHVPTFGQLAGLGNPFEETGDDVAVASDVSALPAAGLSVPALMAVIALVGSTTALVRARRAQRA
jgi:hypothetical protein